MEKRIIEAGVPETGGPFNLCVRHGDMLYVSGLPPFERSIARSSAPPAPAAKRRRLSRTCPSSNRSAPSWTT